MQRVVAAVESRVAVQAPVAAIEAAAAAVLRGDGACRACLWQHRLAALRVTPLHTLAVLDEAADGADGALSAGGDASPEGVVGPCKTKLQLARGLRHAPY